MSDADPALPQFGESPFTFGEAGEVRVVLTKRELFAAMAMHRIAGSWWNTQSMEDQAKVAVQQADALLTELEKKP